MDLQVCLAGQQMYLIEVFIDNIAINLNEKEEEIEKEIEKEIEQEKEKEKEKEKGKEEGKEKKSGTRKKYMLNIQYGPNIEYLVKESQLVQDDREPEIINDQGAQGDQTRSLHTYRIGKSVLLYSCAHDMLETFIKYPLSVEVWDDDDTEEFNILVGRAKYHWDLDFHRYFRDTCYSCNTDQPSLTMKPTVDIYDECCCQIIGQIQCIVRTTSLGAVIITEYQQLQDDPENFLFHTNKAPGIFKCNRVEREDPQYHMERSLYQIQVEEQPETISNYNKPIEVCTELDSCGVRNKRAKIPNVCGEKAGPGEAPLIDKIRMGDIKGPCGNANCPLVHRVKNYIRNTQCYKKKAKEQFFGMKPPEPSKKVCGACYCKHDKYHSESANKRKDLPICKGCGGTTQQGETCADRLERHYGTGLTPKQSATRINYVNEIIYNRDRYNKSKRRSLRDHSRDFIVQNCQASQCHTSRGSKRSKHKNSNNYSSTITDTTTTIGTTATDGTYYNSPLVSNDENLSVCKGCRGSTRKGQTCQDRFNKHYGTGFTPKPSSTRTSYVTDFINNYKAPNLETLFESKKSKNTYNNHSQNTQNKISYSKLQRNFFVLTCFTSQCLVKKKESRSPVNSRSNLHTSKSKIHKSRSNLHKSRSNLKRSKPNLHRSKSNIPKPKSNQNPKHSRQEPSASISSQKSDTTNTSFVEKMLQELEYEPEWQTMASNYVTNIYNTNVSTNKDAPHAFCTDLPDDKDCKCAPTKPTAPCKTFDCECLTKTAIKDRRKRHKPYCPLYKHTETCPVSMMNEEETTEYYEDEDEDALPYGLPPISLGPCPVLGRPCTVPDGFARMYKVGALPKLPPSYSEAGKVCCSKEYERVRKAIKEYIDKTKEDDFRCLNKFYVDTETRCCDKEQRLLALLGKSCCGTHKIALNEKWAEENPK